MLSNRLNHSKNFGSAFKKRTIRQVRSGLLGIRVGHFSEDWDIAREGQNVAADWGASSKMSDQDL